jgi:hypothetical protein
MLKTTTSEFRKIFLENFTKELINTFKPPEIVELKTRIKQEEKIENRPLYKKIKEKINITKHPIRRFSHPIQTPFKFQERPLPQRLQYIQPTPREIPMDLEKIGPILKNPKIKSITCNGPNKEILANSPNPKKTNISLSKEEIDEIIEEFSKISRIPIENGIYRVAAGNLMLLAVISEVTDTKFTIKKIIPMQQLMPRRI